MAIENALMIEEVIEKERMEEELNIAKDLQVSMLPAVPEIEGLEIAAYSMSAREVGGDFYDFIAMGEEKVGMLIGDVTGKSVSGALVMSASRSIFRMLSEEERTVADIMIRANQRTKKDIMSGYVRGPALCGRGRQGANRGSLQCRPDPAHPPFC